MANKRICTHEGCNGTRTRRDFCQSHYRQIQRYGHILTKEEISTNRTAKMIGTTRTLGKHWSIKDTSRMKGRHPKSEFKKSLTPWNKSSEETEKILNNRMRLEFNKKVRNLVFARDDYTCQICDARGGNLHADHIKSWATNPDLRMEVSNCRTLCVPCHYYITFKKRMPAGNNWAPKLSKRGVTQ